jgi:hypothetical protein
MEAGGDKQPRTIVEKYPATGPLFPRMARTANAVAVDTRHHVAQRGKGRRDFFSRKLGPPDALTFGSIAFLKPLADKVNWQASEC